MKLNQITEIIKTSIKGAYDEGFVDGSTKQAIMEFQGLARFLEELRPSQLAVEADAKCSADFHKEEYLNGSTFCRICGARIRTA